MMVVIALSCCPPKLRGDLSRWMIEIDTGVYVGNLNPRIRDGIWDRICKNIGNGHASMSFSSNNEQKLDFRIYNTDWQPTDYDGIKLIKRIIPANDDQKYKMRSKAVTNHINILSQSSRKSSDSPDSYVVIDIETTGVKENDLIIEIGALRVQNSEAVEYFSTLVNCGSQIPKEITKLTGISSEDILSKGVPIENALRQFISFIGESTLVGHNIRFDIDFLQSACQKTGLSVIANKTLDTMRISRKKLYLSNYSLSTVSEHFGIERAQLHRAVKDCETTFKVFEKLKEI